MSNNFGITPLIPGLVNEVALEIFLHFVAIDWDGPFTLVLVCTAWRDIVLRSKSLKRLRRDRCRPNPAPIENRENAEEGICIVSFDGGGPGSMSQLRILDEVMIRMAFSSDTEVDELLPADYFDLMGGVGFGGLVAILLGRLRMTTKQAMEELSEIGANIFPKGEEMVTTEVTMARLRNALERLLKRHGHSTDMKLRDSSGNRCKVVLFAATTAVIDHCHPFRTYRSPRKCLDCTLVDAACATMATPEHFSSVVIGPRLRKQSFAGIPHGFDNPMTEVLKEAQLIFGEKKPVSLVLSLGSGQRARLSDLDRHVTRQSHICCEGVARYLQHQLRGCGEYLRLNVDKGMETIELDDWHELGSIESYTEVYLEMNQITRYIDRAVQWLLQRNGSVTLGQMSGTSTECVATFHSETLKDYLTMEFKQMHNVVQQLGIEKITLVDAMGNNIPIPLEFCLTYNMLSDVINLYFKHQKAPGSDFVERGDYRLVHGNRRNVVGAIEWTGIEKVGLKVEMSMILRTRNEDKPKCPSCRTLFEGSATDGWARCLSCLRQFQVETRVEAKASVQFDDTTSTRRESKSGKPWMRRRVISREAKILLFRLFSVINIREVDEIPNQPSVSIVGHGVIPPVTAYDGAHSLQCTTASPCLDTTMHAPRGVEVVKVPSPTPATTTTTIVLTTTTLSGPPSPTMSNPHAETEMAIKDTTTASLSPVPSHGSTNSTPADTPVQPKTHTPPRVKTRPKVTTPASPPPSPPSVVRTTVITIGGSGGIVVDSPQALLSAATVRSNSLNPVRSGSLASLIHSTRRDGYGTPLSPTSMSHAGTSMKMDVSSTKGGASGEPMDVDLPLPPSTMQMAQLDREDLDRLIAPLPSWYAFQKQKMAQESGQALTLEERIAFHAGTSRGLLPTDNLPSWIGAGGALVDDFSSPFPSFFTSSMPASAAPLVPLSLVPQPAEVDTSTTFDPASRNPPTPSPRFLSGYGNPTSVPAGSGSGEETWGSRDDGAWVPGSLSGFANIGRLRNSEPFDDLGLSSVELQTPLPAVQPRPIHFPSGGVRYEERDSFALDIDMFPYQTASFNRRPILASQAPNAPQRLPVWKSGHATSS